MADRTQNIFAFIGSYTEESSPGIYACSFDSSEGKFTVLDSVSGIKNPTFLTVNKTSNKLYSVSESSDKTGQVLSFQIEPSSGKLTGPNEQTIPGATCHIIADHTYSCLFVASYGKGFVAALPLDENGEIEEMSDVHWHEGSSTHPKRQTKPHPHSVFIDPDNRFALAPDLGTDQIWIYKLDLPNGKMILSKKVPLHSGAGPRHFCFHPSLPYGYVINEMDSTVTAFSYDGEQGDLTKLQTISTLPETFTGDSSTADIHISPDGRFLYGSNRGHDSIVIYAIDPATGTLRLIDHESTLGEHPRNFAISPDGHFVCVANRDTNNIVTFKRDELSGKLEHTGHILECSKPVCIQFMTR